ncbi:LysR family transcriptional regulator [Pseudomonas sp. CVAP|uniref:LysR family transcriptional regulator n=1 Tax=Pseudomonas sp. CVAP\|nr:LysR family transcriptional regulator [Pseudomonas sp. CVAP\
MLDLNEVAMFVQVVQAGSFASAARRMGMPANTLSRRISQLEEHLGVRLLQRSTRKLVLTEAGRSLHDRSATQVNDLIEAARHLAGESQEPSGAVRVAAPADFFDVYLMDWVAEFFQQYPGVQLDFLLSDSRDDLIDKGIDVAIRAGDLPDSSLVARRVGTGSQVLAASPGYLQVHGTPDTVQALSMHECIRRSRQAPRTAWNLDGPQGFVSVEVTGRFSANTAQAQLKAAVAGLGICLLPMAILRESLQAGRLIQVLPEHGRFNNGLYIVYPSRRQVPRAVSVFAEQLIKHLREDALAEGE